MIASKRSTLALCGISVGAGLIAATAMTPALAGSAPSGRLAGGCSATAHIDSQWGSGTTAGQIVTISVTNDSAAPTTRWNVTWMLGGQQIVSAWNATVTRVGTDAVAANAPYNGVLAPGASTTFGMQLSGPASTPVPSCSSGTPGSSGPTHTGPTDPSPSSSAPPGAADVMVNQADNRTTVHLVVRQTLSVSLGAEFHQARLSGPALARFSASGGYPTGQSFAATYRAVAAGSVDLVTESDYACLHTSPPCAVPIVQWTVHVIVVDGPPTGTGQTVTVSTADNLRTVGLHVGDTLVVNLSSMYLQPSVSPAGVIVPSGVTGGYPTDQPVVARFAATTPGNADVITISDAACNHQTPPCPSPQVSWTLHVTVTS